MENRPAPARGTGFPAARWLTWLAIVVGLALIVVAIVYWVEPAKSLPSFFPGHEA